jgi:D-alanine--D-alanine ligase
MKKNVVIICGTSSLEHAISLRGAYYVSQELTASNKYNLLFIGITKSGIWKYSHTITSLLHAVDKIDTIHINEECSTIFQIGYGCINHSKIDCAFLTTLGAIGEDGHLQGYLTLNNIPYTGCGVSGSVNCFNKNICKYIAESISIPTVPYICIHQRSYDSAKLLDLVQHLGEDLVVKVNRGGSSIGVTKCSRSDLLATVEDAFKIDTIILIEPFLKIREISIGALERKGEIECSDLGEVMADNTQIYDFTSKYYSSSISYAELNTSPNVSQHQIDTICDYTRKLFIHLDLKNYARLDFFLYKDKITFAYNRDA